MKYETTETRIAIVLNGRHELGALMNAMGHVTAGLAADHSPSDLEILDYGFKERVICSRISRLPIIVLKAKNANQLRTMVGEGLAASIPINVFATSMIGASAKAQQDATAETDIADADLLAVAVVGGAEVVGRLTKRFSLFR